VKKASRRRVSSNYEACANVMIRFFNGFKKYFNKSNAAKKAVNGTPGRKSSGMFLSVSEGFCSCVEIRQFFPCGGGEKELGEAEENWTNSLLQRWNS
jgi:hypothetical protein